MPFIDFGVATSTEQISVEYRQGGRGVVGSTRIDVDSQVWIRFGQDMPRVWLFPKDAEALVNGLSVALAEHAMAWPNGEA